FPIEQVRQGSPFGERQRTAILMRMAFEGGEQAAGKRGGGSVMHGKRRTEDGERRTECLRQSARRFRKGGEEGDQSHRIFSVTSATSVLKNCLSRSVRPQSSVLGYATWVASVVRSIS